MQQHTAQQPDNFTTKELQAMTLIALLFHDLPAEDQRLAYEFLDSVTTSYRGRDFVSFGSAFAGVIAALSQFSDVRRDLLIDTLLSGRPLLSETVAASIAVG